MLGVPCGFGRSKIQSKKTWKRKAWRDGGSLDGGARESLGRLGGDVKSCEKLLRMAEKQP